MNERARRGEARTVVMLSTARSRKEAERIASTLVAERLVACVNLVAPVTSVFRWQGVVERAREVLLIIKTRRTAVARVTSRIRELHSYDVPEVIVLAITGGAASYLAWILPHGIPELTAITLCTTAGFVLGRAVATPGRSTRSEALRRAGPTALALFLVSVPLFFAAAWIESFVRESALGTAPRFAVAAAGALILFAFAVFARNLRANQPDELDWLDELIRDHSADPADQPAP